MTDLSLAYDNATGSADLVMNGPDLAVDDSLQPAVLLSVGLDRRAPDGVAIPDGTDDRRGWWGDAFAAIADDELGSHRWLLDRETVLPETVKRLQDYDRAALTWLTADGVAKDVVVSATSGGANAVNEAISITRPDGSAGLFDFVWGPR